MFCTIAKRKVDLPLIVALPCPSFWSVRAKAGENLCSLKIGTRPVHQV